jgi:hypothetical protein
MPIAQVQRFQENFAAAPAKRHKQDKQTELRDLVARSRARGFDLAVA